MKKKCSETESAYQIVKHDLEATKEDLCRVEEDLKWYIHRLRIVVAFVLQRFFLLGQV
jgi:hypothetical protein